MSYAGGIEAIARRSARVEGAHVGQAAGYLAAPLSPLSPTAGPPGSAHPPIAIPGMRQTSVVGWRIGGTHADGTPQTWHAGLDLAGAEGTPVYAVREGLVILSVPDSSPGFAGYGQTVVVYHPAEELTVAYAHLSARTVEAGQTVSPGTQLGAIGRTSSGRFPTMGAHLHFELRARIPEGSEVRARTVRLDGRPLLTRSPWPGPYSHPNRDPARFAAVWRNPLEWLAGLGIQGPPLPYGASGSRFSIVEGSAADARAGLLVATAPPPVVPAVATTTPGRRVDVEPPSSPLEGVPLDFTPPPPSFELPRRSTVAGALAAVAALAITGGVIVLAGRR
jgi:murein DD-endopeptidase MepM/ murein hydrolase activator NlpD